MEWYLGPLRKYADFSGRASRQEFWLFVLGNIVIVCVLSLFLLPLGMLYWLGTLVPYWAVWVRRLHDTNRDGYWVFFSMIPLVGFIGMTVMMCSKGTDGRNDYGPDPLAVTALDVEPHPEAIFKPSAKPSTTTVVQQGSRAQTSQCVKDGCTAELPRTAKFCGTCGHPQT